MPGKDTVTERNSIANAMTDIKARQDLLSRAMFVLWQIENWCTDHATKRNGFLASLVATNARTFANQPRVAIFFQPNLEYDREVDHIEVVRAGLEEALNVKFSSAYLDISEFGSSYPRETATFGNDVILVLRTAK